MGRKKAELRLSAKDWHRFIAQPAHLVALVAEDQHRAAEVVRELAAGCMPGGALHAPETCNLRLQVLALLENHAVALCGDAPVDATRQLFECVRDRLADPTTDGPEAAARLQLAALHALTTLLIKLEMQQRDARLVKVHVQTLYRIMERSGQYSGASTDLRRTAATCLRRMEEAVPTLLLAGCKQLLDLARQEASAAAESYVKLAACVLSHGAARCLDLPRPTSSQSIAEDAAAGDAAPAARSAGAGCCTGGSGKGRRHGAVVSTGVATVIEVEEEEEAEADRQDAFTVLSSVDFKALSLTGGPACQLHPSGIMISPVGTLDSLSHALAAVASACSTEGTGSEGHSSPKEVPGSPRGVASMAGTASTFDSSALAAAVQQGATTQDPDATFVTGPPLASSEISGSVQESAVAQPLLCSATQGLRHYRVPMHLHWPDALAHTAVCVYVSPEAQQDVQKACLEFLAAMPRLSADGVACLTAAMPAIMRLADLPPRQLQEALDSLLQAGEAPASRTLMLQAILKLYNEVPPGMTAWQQRMVDTLLRMINGAHPPEHRVIAITWALVQHHSQMHARKPSLFAGSWRQLMPLAHDPPQLLSLKVKALSACLAVGIGDPEEICPMVFAWDGFWQAQPSDQQQRLCTYALRMLGSAAVSYRANVQHAQRTQRSAAAGAAAVTKPPATPHYVMACLASACLQLVATRPQHLPAVDAFLANCANSSKDLQAVVLNALDALFSAAATGTFSSLQAHGRGRAAGSGIQAAKLHPAMSNAGASNCGNTPKSGLGGMLQRMRNSLSKRMDGPSPATKAAPGPSRSSSQLSTGTSATLPASTPAMPVQVTPSGSSKLPAIAESPDNLAAPKPWSSLETQEEAEAWLWDSRTWAALSVNMLAHDPLIYRSLLLRLAQTGTSVLPMGALRFLAAYGSQYQCELPSHCLPAKEAGSCVLAICQSAAMTHLLTGPAGTAVANPARGRARRRGGEDGSAHSGVYGGSPEGSAHGSATPQWTLQQEEIAVAMQAVLSALTSHSPIESVRRRAQSFLDLLANPSAWDLRVRMGTMAKMLGGYFSDAVSAAAYL